MLSLEFQPWVPGEVLAAAAAAMVVLNGAAFYRRLPGRYTHAAIASALLLLFAGPAVLVEERTPLPDIAGVVIDRSERMRLNDRPERVQALLARLQASVPQLRIEETGLNAAEPDLPGAVRRVLSQMPEAQIAGVFIISDGISALPDAAALRPGVPVHLLSVADLETSDRSIEITAAPASVRAQSDVSLGLLIRDSRASGSSAAPVDVQFLRDGALVKTVSIPINTPATVNVPAGGVGIQTFEAVLPPRPGDLTRANDRAWAQVRATRADKLKVLLLSGRPGNGTRMWRSLLKNDPGIDALHFAVLRPPDVRDPTPASDLALIPFPAQTLFGPGIRDFDLIVFDDFRCDGLIDDRLFDNIIRYVEQGGALLVSVSETRVLDREGSDTCTRFENLLPLLARGRTIVTPFRPQPTAIGRRSPMLAGLDLQAIAAAPAWQRYVYSGSVPQGQVLLSTDTPEQHPILLFSTVGRGSVVQLMSDQLWLWSRGDAGPYLPLLRGLVQRLLRDPEYADAHLRLLADATSVTLELRTGTDAAPPPAQLTDADGRVESVTLHDSPDGVYRARVQPQTPGVVQVRVGEAYESVVFAPQRAAALLRTDAVASLSGIQATGGQRVFYQQPPVGVAFVSGVRSIYASGNGQTLFVRRRDASLPGVTRGGRLLTSGASACVTLLLLCVAWRREIRAAK